MLNGGSGLVGPFFAGAEFLVPDKAVLRLFKNLGWGAIDVVGPNGERRSQAGGSARFMIQFCLEMLHLSANATACFALRTSNDQDSEHESIFA